MSLLKLAIITTIVLLSSILLANINPVSSLLKPQLAFAQASGQASIDVGNDTGTPTSPLPPTNQGSLKESFEDSTTKSPLITNYSFPFVEDQQDQTFSSSPFASTMGLNMFMNSFANSIFNGTSIFGGLGTSMVNNVKVSGISLDNNGSQLSVTLNGTPTELSGRNNTVSMKNDTITKNSSNSVSIIAMRIPINMADILSLAATSSSQDMDTSMMTRDFNQDSILHSDGFNPFSLLSDLQIGSTNITNVDWSVPQKASMKLVASTNTQEQQPYSNNTSASDFLLVSVIPYTGLNS